MFKLFRKKKPTQPKNDLLQLGDFGFVEAVHKSVVSESEAFGAMCLIALENIKPIMAATLNMAKQNPNENLPKNFDEFVRHIANAADSQTGEVAKRRMQWFFFACLIMRCTSLARKEVTLAEKVADLWAHLARSGAMLPEIVDQNQIWQDDEKVWFANIASPAGGVNYVLSVMVPGFLKSNPRVKAVAIDNELFPLPH